MTLEIELSDAQLAKIADMVAKKLAAVPSLPKASYTVEEAAKRLNVSGRTIRDRIKAGTIPHIPGIGGVLRIPGTFIEGLLNPNPIG